MRLRDATRVKVGEGGGCGETVDAEESEGRYPPLETMEKPPHHSFTTGRGAPALALLRAASAVEKLWRALALPQSQFTPAPTGVARPER